MIKSKRLIRCMGRIVTLLSIIAMLTLNLLGCSALTLDNNNNYSDNNCNSTNGSSGAGSIGSSSGKSISDYDFSVLFIDVGQADSALVHCDGHFMLIDGGNREDSNLIYTVLKNNGVSHLDYIVGTHAHEDHIGGLPGALQLCTVDTVFSPVTSYDSKAFDNFKKKAQERGASLTVPNSGDVFSLGSAEVTILAPINDYDDTNNTSIVLRIVYGETSFLFTGDAERESELDMINSGCELKSDVLKVGHHGSDSSTSYVFLNEVMPKYAIISVGEGNSYGHPTDAVLSRLRDADSIVLRTDESGDILCTSDGKEVSVFVGNGTSANNNIQSTDDNTEEYRYVGNKRNNKLHKITCSTLPAEENREYFKTREDAVNAGYDDECGNCKP